MVSWHHFVKVMVVKLGKSGGGLCGCPVNQREIGETECWHERELTQGWSKTTARKDSGSSLLMKQPCLIDCIYFYVQWAFLITSLDASAEECGFYFSPDVIPLPLRGWTPPIGWDGECAALPSPPWLTLFSQPTKHLIMISSCIFRCCSAHQG